MARLTGITVLVVGAAGALNEALVGRLVAEGARVVAAGRSVDDRGSVGNPYVRQAALDIVDAGSWEALIADIESVEGELHGFVHIAGRVETGMLRDMAADRLRATIDANLVAPALGMRSTAPLVAASGGGSIITIASNQAVRGAPNAAISAASNWGLRGLTRSAALELGPSGIRVNTVCPSAGLLGEPAMAADETGSPDEERDLATGHGALADDGTERKVTFGDVAAMVVFLLSDDSATCTGGDFLVDGGATA